VPLPIRIREELMTLLEHVGVQPMGEAMADTHIDLIESPPHRAAILDPRWQYTGMGVVFDDKGHLMLTQLFAV
jgi:uncharacterized protein YkwD